MLQDQDVVMADQTAVDDDNDSTLVEPLPLADEVMPTITEANAVADGDDAKDDPLSGEWTVAGYPWYEETVGLAAKWRLLLFPKGNPNIRRSPDFISLFLDAGDSLEQDYPIGWQRIAQFDLILVNQVDASKTVRKDTSHTFNSNQNDWGFNQFVLVSDVLNNGFVVDDTLILKVIIRTTHYEPYNSKKETGFVGLKNQGATCYMNSLLQTLYNINLLRQAVYHMPTSEEDEPEKSLPLALQSLFYKLQFGSSPVGTEALTKSFGWDSYESLMQHDVQELNRVLCEKLEDKMKSTRVEGTINKLFEGHTYNFIECVNIDYKSTRKESFMDIQLDVKGCKNIYESFDRYTETEMLDGANQYNAEQHGLQDARKGVSFDSFPPVLQLQLKRFEYDFQRDIMVKINDRYEFYEELDLDQQGHKYLSPNADRSTPNKYRLHSVLVHSGGVHGGHYYAFINPDGSQWLKFDDDKVTKEDAKRAIQEQWGGDDDLSNGNPPPSAPPFNQPLKITRFSNAYMLVYVREADWDKVMCTVSELDIYEHVRVRLKAEQEEKERLRKERAEAHKYTYVRVATDADMQAQIGSARQFDLVDHDKVTTLKVGKAALVSALRTHVQEEMGVLPEAQRLWLWHRRQNGTFRPSCVVGPDMEQKQLTDLKDSGRNTQYGASEVKLFLETPPAGETTFPVLDKNQILLFFKQYDPITETLSYAGHTYASKHAKVASLFPMLRTRAGYGDDDDVLVFEEVKFEPDVMCNQLEPLAQLGQMDLEHGDILCFQRGVSKGAGSGRFATVAEYLTYVKNKVVITFKRHPEHMASKGPPDDGMQLELTVDMTYEDVTRRLATELGIEDHLLLRLTQSNAYASDMPKTHPIKYAPKQQLDELMTPGHGARMLSVFYFEVLDIPLPQLERLKSIKVCFYNSRTEEVSSHTLRLPKEGCVSDLLAELQRQLGEEHSGRPLRLLEISYSRIYKVFTPEEKIDQINDAYWRLRAEQVEDDEAMLEDGDLLLHVVHLNPRMQNDTFGEPFLLKVGPQERLSSVKQRIQAKLGTSDEEFAKWKFGVVRNMRGAADPLEEDDVVASKFVGTGGEGHMGHDNYLALEHEATGRRGGSKSRSGFSTYERAIKIYG